MSDRKNPRKRRCQMCHQAAEVLVHKKCYNCRVGLQMGRYARQGKMDKFVKPKSDNSTQADYTY